MMFFKITLLNYFSTIYLVVVLTLFVESVTVTEKCNFTNFVSHEKVWIKKVGSAFNDFKYTFELLRGQQQKFSQSVPRKAERSQYLEVFPNAFALARRLSKIWPVTRSIMTTAFGDMLKTPALTVNSTQLWRSAMTALVRLQSTYNLSTDTIATGSLDGAYNHTHFTGGDCYDVGEFYCNLSHTARCEEWLLAALERASEDPSVFRPEVLELLHLAQCVNGDPMQSSKTLITLLQDYPLFSPSEKLREDYSFTAKTSCRKLAAEHQKGLGSDEQSPYNVEAQKGLCRKDNYSPPSDSRLRCRLIHYNHPHLRFWPYKMEELHLDPPLLLFHDVIHDGEIKMVKSLYHNRTRKAMLDYGTTDSPYQDTQYTYWLINERADNNMGRKIALRSARVTNMGLYRSDFTMVASYGVGAEIKVHRDIGPTERILKKGYSRADYVSLTYYLNDVPEGGYTIFPLIKRAVVPAKGSALLWFNRLPDWEINMNMSHSGCPILRGSKWIITKWLHVLGQSYPKCRPGKEKSFKYYYLDDQQ